MIKKVSLNLGDCQDVISVEWNIPEFVAVIGDSSDWTTPFHIDIPDGVEVGINAIITSADGSCITTADSIFKSIVFDCSSVDYEYAITASQELIISIKGATVLDYSSNYEGTVSNAAQGAYYIVAADYDPGVEYKFKVRTEECGVVELVLAPNPVQLNGIFNV